MSDTYQPTDLDISIVYTPSSTALAFHQDTSKVRGILGPVGSGKSVAMVNELMLKAIEQRAFRGYRKTRWVVVRNTYAELRNTTMKTFRDWIPNEICPVKWIAPPTALLTIPLADGTIVEAEFIFLALDREDDQKKLRSFEYTGGWNNEAQFSDPEITRVMLQRSGRYPRKERDPKTGEVLPDSGASWSGLIMDFNAPDTDHYLYKAFEEETRDGWKLFKQPPAVIEVDGVWQGNPDAENIENLEGGHNYYLSNISAMKRSQVMVDFCAQWGVSTSGMPVYADSYDDDVHTSENPVPIDSTLPVYMGMDFGLHPAVVFGQMTREGVLVIVGELDPALPQGVGFDEFLDDYYRPFVLNELAGVTKIIGFGDPSAIARSSVDGNNMFYRLEQEGIQCEPIGDNKFLGRKEAVQRFLAKRKGFLLGKQCTRLRKGFLGGYGYKRISSGYKSEPDKNEFSHPHDALQYLCQGILALHAPKIQYTNRKTGVAF